MKELSVSRIWLADDESPTNVGNLELFKRSVFWENFKQNGKGRKQLILQWNIKTAGLGRFKQWENMVFARGAYNYDTGIFQFPSIFSSKNKR